VLSGVDIRCGPCVFAAVVFRGAAPCMFAASRGAALCVFAAGAVFKGAASLFLLCI
jgi:hypothetical protein